MKALIILNDPPYGSERSYNGLRLAYALAKTKVSELRLFLMADAVACAKIGQQTPDGYYNLERMLRGLAAKGVSIAACGTCMDARALAETDLIAGVHRSSMEELSDWTLWADQVIVY